jgi:hypothetical protein
MQHFPITWENDLGNGNQSDIGDAMHLKTRAARLQAKLLRDLNISDQQQM